METCSRRVGSPGVGSELGSPLHCFKCGRQELLQSFLLFLLKETSQQGDLPSAPATRYRISDQRRRDSQQPILFFLFGSCVEHARRSLCLQASWRGEPPPPASFYCTREQKQGDETVKQECCNKCGCFPCLMNVDEGAEPEASRCGSVCSGRSLTTGAALGVSRVGQEPF